MAKSETLIDLLRLTTGAKAVHTFTKEPALQGEYVGECSVTCRVQELVKLVGELAWSEKDEDDERDTLFESLKFPGLAHRMRRITQEKVTVTFEGYVE